MRRTCRYSTSEVYQLADDGDERAIAVVWAVASCNGPGRYATRQWKPQTTDRRFERRSSPGRTRIETIATKQFDVARERQRLRLEVMRRLS